MSSRCFKLYRAYPISCNSSNVGKFFWSWILKKFVVLCSRPRLKVKLGTIPGGTISRRRRATTAKKCTKKRDASATLFAVSVLGTYFACQGVKCIYLNFTLWPCMETFVVQRSRSSPPSMGHTTVENTLAQYKMWKPSHDVHVQRFKDSKERRDWQLLLQVIYLVNNCEAITIFYRAT